MSKSAIAFLTGLGAGYMTQNDKNKKQSQDDEDRALRNKASQLQIDAAEQQISDKRALRQAAAPIAMTEGAGGMVKPDTMDNRDVGLPENAELPNEGLNKGAYSVAGKTFADPISANAELATQNAPEARSKRVMTALSGIDPLKALDAEHTQTQRGRETIKFTQEQETYAKKLKDEGAIDALKALRVGDGAGMVAAFNKSGQYKIEGEPQIKAEQRDIAGQVIPTFTATFQVQDKDGNVKPMTINSHDMSMSLMPYEKWYDAQLKTSKEGRENNESASKIGLQGAQADYYRSAAGAKDSAATKPVVDRMSEIDKTTLASINKQREAINTAMIKAQAEGSWDPAAPGSKLLATKLAALSLQESQLAEKYRETSDGTPDPLGMRKPTGPTNSSERQMKTAATGGMGADAGALAREIAATKQQMAGATDPASRQLLQDHIMELERQGQVYQAPRAPANMASGGAAPAKEEKPAAAPAPKPSVASTAGAAAPAEKAALAPAADPVADREKAIAVALGAGGTSAVDKIVAAKVPQIREAADKIKAAQDELKAGAKKGDPAELKKLAQAVADARAGAEALLKDMNKPQADKVRAAAGYNT